MHWLFVMVIAQRPPLTAPLPLVYVHNRLCLDYTTFIPGSLLLHLTAKAAPGLAVKSNHAGIDAPANHGYMKLPLKSSLLGPSNIFRL
jgi:hypothetical protein